MLGKFKPYAIAPPPDVQTDFHRHYVAFIRKHIADIDSEAWVLFNDEKVAKASNFEEMKKFAYIYFLRRV